MKQLVLASAIFGLATIGVTQTPLTRTAAKSVSVNVASFATIVLDAPSANLIFDPAKGTGSVSVGYHMVTNAPFFVTIGGITKPTGVTGHAVYTATSSVTSGIGNPDVVGTITVSVTGIGLYSAAKTYTGGHVTITVIES